MSHQQTGIEHASCDQQDLCSDVYKCILSSLSEAVCAVNLDWRIVCFNQQAQALTGVSRKDALNASFADVFPIENSKLHNAIKQVIRHGDTVQKNDINLINCHGERIPVIVTINPVIDTTGSIKGATIILQDNRYVELLRKELRQKYTFNDIVTKDERILQIIDTLPNIAENNTTVLIQGETGTGKELLANAIHNASHRRSGPFVAINCGALPNTLLESELFGYKKGAFTDAKNDKPGRISLAEGGTLLLDEIGDVSPAIQVKLLRFLEEKQYEPLGGTESVKADVRILAATNRDLQELVTQQKFRADLYYRLNVIEFRLPPLCDRRDDIRLLLERFIEVLNAEKGRHIKRISKRAMNHLMGYSYPGNVRELRNILEHSYVLCTGDEIRSDCLPPRIFSASPNNSSPTPSKEYPTPLHRMAEEEQKNRIIENLQKHNGHRGNTANTLGIDKSTLWRKMKKFGLL